MPKMNVVRSKNIDVPIETVYKTISDLHTWATWSPWLVIEPDAKITVADGGKYYEWEGKRTGKGNMRITSEVENESVNYDLTFLTPWKSESKVRFNIATDGDSTKLDWTMDGSMPWFMFWMTGMMETFIGMDFERGLTMLKEYLEKGEINSTLEFLGESEFEGVKYIGIKTTCKMAEIGDFMTSDLEKLSEYCGDKSQMLTGFVGTVYTDWNMKNSETTYVSCFGVTNYPESLPDGFITGEIPASTIYKLRHIGSYDHLGNAWTTGQTMMRNKEFKSKKGFYPFEWYVSDPHETDPKELITDICFGVK